MATITIKLTQDYQEVSAASLVLTGEVLNSGTVEIVNADSTPASTVKGHSMFTIQPNILPAPASGSWYARITSGSGFLVATEV